MALTKPTKTQIANHPDLILDEKEIDARTLG